MAEVRNGRLELQADESDWKAAEPSDIDGIPDEADRIPYEDMKSAIDSTNEAIENGRGKLVERNNEMRLEFESSHPGNGVGR